MLLPAICLAFMLNCKDEQLFELPEENTLLLEAGVYSNDVSTSRESSVRQNATDLTGGNCFTGSATVVNFINLEVYALIIVPATLFKAIHENGSLEIDGDTHTWTVSHTVNNVTYSGILKGVLNGDNIDWTLSLNWTAGGFSLEWVGMEGTTSKDNLSGNWVVNDPIAPFGSDTLYRADWDFTNSSSKSFSIENIATNSARDESNVGDSVTYSLNGTSASIVVFEASQDTDVNTNDSRTASATWDTETHVGMADVQPNSGGFPCCWSSRTDSPARGDVTCP